MLVETLAGDFDPDEFEDDYAEAVQTVVRTKIEGGDIQRTPTSTKTGGEVVDLLAALQRSVDAAKSARGEEKEQEKPAKKTASKKADSGKSKKAPAKKSAAKKTAKKSTTKKAAAKKAS
jgi:DNA end-binding protein Ku